MTTKGHNSKKTRAGGVVAYQLRSVVERLEKLIEEKAAIATDITEIYTEAGANGFCKKTIRQIVKLRSLDANEREEAETILDTYKRALGMAPQLDMFDDDAA